MREIERHDPEKVRDFRDSLRGWKNEEVSEEDAVRAAVEESGNEIPTTGDEPDEEEKPKARRSKKSD